MKIDVTKIARLANIPLKQNQKETLEKQFEETVDFVNKLQEVDVTNTPPTSQVTGTTNVFREDKIDTTRTLTQEEALKNAPRKKNGFFVVSKILA